MAISIDFVTKIITVPQADMTFVSGTFYRLPTETKFRADVNALMDDEEGILHEDPISHNTTYIVAGVEYARKIEIINGYSITMSPDSQFSVELVGSNNNLWDVENGILNQNQVQVIPTNSAGLQEITTGGVDSTKVDQIWNALRLDEDTNNTVDSVVFNADPATYNTANTFGNWINEKALTVLKFLSLK